MPLQNRVDPWGRLHAVSARGTLMGNRGVLHDENKHIVRHWNGRRWICCLLEFRGRRRAVFEPHRYSQLFFLDEATAFAAGHRPCAECRRARYDEFKERWIATNSGRREGESRADVVSRSSSSDAHLFAFRASAFHSIDEIDRVLHAERVGPRGEKVTWEATTESLPDGTFVAVGSAAWLIWNGWMHRWTFEGYGEPERPVSRNSTVRVLTPRSIVRAFAFGLVPFVHESLRY